MLRILSPVLLYTPEMHYKAARDVYIDGIIKKATWKALVAKLSEEWGRCVICSTVLLTADISFLTLPNLTPTNTTAIVATQISLILATGSVIAALLLIRRYESSSTSNSAEKTADFLQRRTQRDRGLAALAILHCLPYALLMWGMLAFLAALGFATFKTTPDLSSTVVNAFAWCIVLWTLLGIVLVEIEDSLEMSIGRLMIKMLGATWRRGTKSEGSELGDPEPVLTEQARFLRKLRSKFSSRRGRNLSESRRESVVLNAL